MLSELKTGSRVVGIKQAQRAVVGGTAAAAYVAGDCDERIQEAFSALCADCGVALHVVPTMAELGAACGIQVGAAAAALLK